MVLSNEPGLYKDGTYGMRCENLVVVTEIGKVAGTDRKMLGFEPLTLAPFDFPDQPLLIWLRRR